MLTPFFCHFSFVPQCLVVDLIKGHEAGEALRLVTEEFNDVGSQEPKRGDASRSHEGRIREVKKDACFVSEIDAVHRERKTGESLLGARFPEPNSQTSSIKGYAGGFGVCQCARYESADQCAAISKIPVSS